MANYKHKLINTEVGTLVLPRLADISLADLGQPDVRAESIGPLFPTGSALITDDGVYRYAKCGGVAVAIGKLLQQAAVTSGHQVTMAVAATATVGATSVTITNSTTDITADMYKDGYLYVSDAPGGAIYKIKSHPASTATNSSVVITLVDPIEVELTTSSKVGLRKNIYDGVIVNPTTKSGIPVGVVNHSSFTAEYYAWIKTKGIVSLLTNSTVVVGEPVVAGNTTAGSVDAYNEDGASNNVIVGLVQTVGATTKYSLIKIDLDPSW